MAADKSSNWWYVYAAVVLVGTPYAIFFTRWGVGAYNAVCLLLLIYGFGAMGYSLVRPLFHRLRKQGAAERPVSEVEVQPVAKGPFFVVEPIHYEHGFSVGTPVPMNYGVKKTVLVTVVLAGSGLLVRYSNAVPSRGETLLGVGFMCAILFYLWLLVKFAKSVYRWMKRHSAHAAPASVSETQGH